MDINTDIELAILASQAEREKINSQLSNISRELQDISSGQNSQSNPHSEASQKEIEKTQKQIEKDITDISQAIKEQHANSKTTIDLKAQSAEINELLDRLDKLQKKHLFIRSELSEALDRESKLRRQLEISSQIDETIKATNREIALIRETNIKLEEKLITLQDRIVKSEKDLATAKDDKARQEQDLTATIAREKNLLRIRDSEILTLSTQLKITQSDLAKQLEENKTLAESKDVLEKLINELNGLNKRSVNATEKLSDEKLKLKTVLDRSKNEVGKLTKQIERLASVESQFKAAQREYRKLKSRYTQFEAELSKSTNTLIRLEHSSKKQKDTLQSDRYREELKDLLASFIKSGILLPLSDRVDSIEIISEIYSVIIKSYTSGELKLTELENKLDLIASFDMLIDVLSEIGNQIIKDPDAQSGSKISTFIKSLIASTKVNRARNINDISQELQQQGIDTDQKIIQYIVHRAVRNIEVVRKVQ